VTDQPHLTTPPVPPDRQAILQRLERWLDEVLAAEDPPSGIDAELLATLTASDAGDSEQRADDGRPAGDRVAGTDVDGYGLWAAMTRCAQEVALQGRAFKDLATQLAAHGDVSSLAATQAEISARRAAEEIARVYGERERAAQKDIERRCRRETLTALVDMRDRLERGLATARAAKAAARARDARRTWFSRVAVRRATEDVATVAALIKGYELGLERLDHFLDELRVQPIRCKGEPFDPRRMNAIDRVESASVPPGVVVEVYANGYEWEGELFRPAQVAVSYAP
jgi:molecular chaperone GrpE (heat shock protein)